MKMQFITRHNYPNYRQMKRIIASSIVMLSLLMFFGCKGNKAGQRSLAKDNTSIAGDSGVTEKASMQQEIASEDTLRAIISKQSPKPKDFDFKIAVMRREKTVQVIRYSYPKDDDDFYAEPNELNLDGERTDSCQMADVTFDGNKDLLVFLGTYGNQGVAYWDAYIWDEAKKKFILVPSFREIPNPTINEKGKFIESFSRGSAADYETGKWKYKEGKFVEISHKSEHLTK